MRILIAGGPKTGKTTMAKEKAVEYSIPNQLHTDDLIGEMEWSQASAEVAKWLDQEGPYIIEGVAVGRGLRKWLESHPEGLPCDKIYYLHEFKVPLSKGQVAMFKGCWTVWSEIEQELMKRGIIPTYVPAKMEFMPNAIETPSVEVAAQILEDKQTKPRPMSATSARRYR